MDAVRVYKPRNPEQPEGQPDRLVAGVQGEAGGQKADREHDIVEVGILDKEKPSSTMAARTQSTASPIPGFLSSFDRIVTRTAARKQGPKKRLHSQIFSK